MPPTAVPKFHKSMSVDGWNKSVKVWSDNYLHIPEPMRLTIILEFLKANEDRKAEGRWITGIPDHVQEEV